MFRRLPNPASMTPDERIAYRDAIVGKRYCGRRTDLDDGSCYYANQGGPGRFTLHAFAGKALRPTFIESYRTRERLDERIGEFVASRERIAKSRDARRCERRQPHTLKLGDILNTCWGYDQTNVEFYEVVGVRGSQVLLRELATESVGEAEGLAMSSVIRPLRGEYVGAILRRRADARNCVRIEHGIFASPWNGKPRHVSGGH